MNPERIGRYEIKSEIGRGGMATVFLAHDPRFKRDVALKVLPPQFLHDPTFRARFEREAQIIAAIEHPAIVPVYDFGEQDDQPYLVMRYMSGGSLADRLRTGPLSVKETAAILGRLAGALDEIHSHGIIHRDLKPGNILFDQYGNAYLSDFGIARLTEAAATLTGDAIVGTPSYMSPEQARGETIDGRSDIYALGAILFEMLTGRLPFQATTPMGLVMKHMIEPVPHLLDVRGDLPFELETVINRAMAKTPSDRFQKAVQMATDTEEIARRTGLPSAVPPPPPITPAETARPPVEVSRPAAPPPPPYVPPQAPVGPVGAGAYHAPTPPPQTPAEQAGARAYHVPTPPPPPAYAQASHLTPPPVRSLPAGKARSGLKMFLLSGAGILVGMGLCVALFVIVVILIPRATPTPTASIPDVISGEVPVTTLEVLPPTADQGANVPLGNLFSLPFSDDFSDPTTGWASLTDAGSQTDYYHGSYRIYVDRPNMIYWATPDLYYGDVRLEVDATKVGGADDNYFGLICRYVDENNFYLFTIMSSGYYGIGKLNDGQFSLIGMDGMYYSDSIHQGTTTNHLEVTCEGSRLTFFVNQLKLIEVEDSDFVSGDVGLTAAAFELYGTDILFDNFKAEQP